MGIGNDRVRKLLDQLLDEAVSEGRSMWDSYYGWDNSLHIETVKQEYPTYNQLMDLLDEQDS